MAPLPYALITGASSGIGAEIALLLARRGHPLIIVARREDRLIEVAERVRAAHRVEVLTLALDLSAPDAAARLHAEVRARGLAVGVLVNNAAFGLQGRFLDMDPSSLEQMFRLNIHTLTELTRLFARDMVAAGRGHILQVASAAAFLPSPYVSAYAASKSYVLSFSEALRFELRHSGVSLTVLYPGITETEFNAVASAKTPWIMDASVLSARRVAEIGVAALFAGRRAVVPGWINKINAVLSQVLPRGLVSWMAGWLLERANGHRS